MTRAHAIRPVFLALAAMIMAIPGMAGEPANSIPLSQKCDRACLYEYLEQYLAALEDKDAWRLPWAEDAQVTENSVALPIGDGLWNTITGLGDYRLRFADPHNGQVGFFGAVEEPGATSPFAMRMKVTDGKIREVEMVVRRAADSPLAQIWPEPEYEKKPVFYETLPADKRIPRARLISIVDGYFDTLQLNDGTLFTQFDENCNRVENGLKTTNNPEITDLLSTANLGCQEQFEMGRYLYDDRIRARRFPLVDEKRGLVLASGFIDHKGDLGVYEMADGTTRESSYRRPHTYHFMELFKIDADGEIRQVEAVFLTVPYRMPSSWSD